MATQLLNKRKRRPLGTQRQPERFAEIVINGSVHLPPWVTNHESFRTWACSPDFPERGEFYYLNGKFWVDLSMEKLIHNQIKGAIAAVMFTIVFGESRGHFLFDRMMLTNVAAGLSCEPDGMFVSNESSESGRVAITEGDDSLEIIGSPDMTLEVVSKSSIEKDTIILKELYANAGVAEYWLVDSLIETPELNIWRLVGGKYTLTRKYDGWVKSHVFGRSFRLTYRKDAKGLSHVNLETK